MRPRLFILVSLLLVGASNAQTNIDSLRAVWNDPSKPDTVRLMTMNDYIGAEFLYTMPDSAIHYASVMFDMARQKGSRKYQGQALVLEGLAYTNKGEQDTALDRLHRALAIFESMDDRVDMATALNNLGNVQVGRGDMAQAMTMLMRSLKISESLNDSSMVARLLGNIGVIYHMQEDYDNAMSYYQRRLDIAQAIGQKDIMAEVVANMALIYQERKEYDRAIDGFNRALALSRELGYRQMEWSSLHNLGELYVVKKDFPRALSLYHRAVEVADSIQDPNGVAEGYVGIGNTYREMSDLASARSWGERALTLARRTQDIAVMRDAAELLYKVRKAQGNGPDALAMHELFITLRDSIASDENKQEVMRQRFQYDYEKKEALVTAEQEKKDAVAAEELRLKKVQRNAFIGGFGLMVLLAGVFFVQRNRVSKARKRSDELLLNILPAEVAEELKAKGSAEAVHIDQVTVLFTDFKGFTAMSEVLSPRDLVRDLNECFSAFDRITEKYGIEKIKTIGDAYMAAGGLPTPNTTHATDVIKAAFEMRDFIAEGKARKVAAGLPYFEIRIGIHTGPVVAGIVGVKKFQYDIWGDTVNTASRMESSGEVGRVNISEATYALVKEAREDVEGKEVPAFSFTPRGKVQAKGKGELNMYFVEEKPAVVRHAAD